MNTKGVININRVYDGKETVYSKKLRKWTKQRNKCIKKENKHKKYDKNDKNILTYGKTKDYYVYIKDGEIQKYKIKMYT